MFQDAANVLQQQHLSWYPSKVHKTKEHNGGDRIGGSSAKHWGISAGWALKKVLGYTPIGLTKVTNVN